MIPWILSEAIIIALLEHMDAPTSLAFVSAAKFLQPYIKYVDHIKKLYVGNYSACVITHSGKLVSLIKKYSINGTEYNENQFHNFAEFVKQQKLIIQKVSRGEKHVAAITSTGKLILWGDNRFGQCSLPDEYTGDNETTFRKVSCSNYGTAAITTSGKIVLLGNTKFKEGDSPPEGETFCKIKCGSSHVAALTTTGKLFVWTRHQNSELSHQYIYKNVLFRKINFFYDKLIALTRSGKVVLSGDYIETLRNLYYSAENVFRSVGIGRHILALTATGKIVSWDRCQPGFCKMIYLANEYHKFRKVKCSYKMIMALTSTGELLMCCSALKFDGREDIAAHAKKLIREYK